MGIEIALAVAALFVVGMFVNNRRTVSALRLEVTELRQAMGRAWVNFDEDIEALNDSATRNEQDAVTERESEEEHIRQAELAASRATRLELKAQHERADACVLRPRNNC